MLCFSDSDAISYVSLLVHDRQKQPVTERTMEHFSSVKDFLILEYNVVILIDYLQCNGM